MASNDFFDAFLSPQSVGPSLKGVLELIPRAQLDAWPDQPRVQKRSAAELAATRASIGESAARGAGLGGTGIEQPLTVRPHPDPKLRAKGRFMLVDGEGRFLATAPEHASADLLLPTLLPCLVRELSEAQAWEVASIGGIARQEYAPLDEAGIVQALLDGKNAQSRPLSVREVAAKLSRDRGWVQNRVALSKLRAQSLSDPAISTLINLLSLRNDSLSHILILAEIPDAPVREALRLATEKGASVSQIRECWAILQAAPKPLGNDVLGLIPDVSTLKTALSLRNDTPNNPSIEAAKNQGNRLSLRNDSLEGDWALAARHAGLALKALKNLPAEAASPPEETLEKLEKQVASLRRQLARWRKDLAAKKVV